MSNKRDINHDLSVGEIITAERRKQKISQGKLCEGICTAALLSKIESGERVVDKLVSKRLLARLGVPVENYESYLDYENYQSWKNRMKLIKLIEEEKYKEALKYLEENFLVEDRNKDGIDNSSYGIKKQFYWFMKIQIFKNISYDESMDEIKAMYEKAVKETVQCIDARPLNTFLLSVAELNMVLDYKILNHRTSNIEEIKAFYEEIFLYLDKSNYGEFGKVKIYPKVVVYLYRDIKDLGVAIDNNVGLDLLRLCNTAISYLRNKKCMYYMVEVLEIKKEILESLAKELVSERLKDESVTELKEASELLKELNELYASYGICAYMNNDCYLYRESSVYCINDVIRIRRRMLSLTKKELCEDICSEKTLRRLENKEMTTNGTTLPKLMLRLNLAIEYMNTQIITDSKDAVVLYEQLRDAINRYEYEKVDELLIKLKKILPPNPINEQILLRTETMNEWHKGKATPEENIENLKKVINKTIDYECLLKYEDDIFLSGVEFETVYAIAVVLKKEKRYEEAFSIIKIILNQLDKLEQYRMVEGYIGRYEVVTMFYASLLGSMGQYDTSDEVSKKLMRYALSLRTSVTLHMVIYNIAWNDREKNISKLDYLDELRRCIKLCGLTNNENMKLFYKKKMEL